MQPVPSLMICADPGARSHFVASWLQGDLIDSAFDVGLVNHTQFLKKHTDWNNCVAKQFNGKKIRIKTSFCMLDLHLFLFLIKNVYPQIPGLNADQFSFDVTTKMIESAKDWLYHDQQVELCCYDRVLSFSDTFDSDCMIELYQWFNDGAPSDDYIEILHSCNQANKMTLPRNHSCVIAAMILEKEHRLNLPEIDRFWSLLDVYAKTEQNELYDTITGLICHSNYGKSDLHGIGVNERTRQHV